MNLQHFSEFKEILDKYQISDSARQVLKNLKLVLLIAPSSGGRNTVIRHQVATSRYYYIVSDTTRKPRINDGVLETNGKEYWFRTEKQILTDLKNGNFLEAELIHGQQVSGISIRELKKAQDIHKIAITDVDLDGIHKIIKAKPDTFAIMLLPPSFDIWQSRMKTRGHIDPQELKRRMQTAQSILQDALKQDYYHFVITEDVKTSAKIIDGIVAGQPSPHDRRATTVIKEIQTALRENL